METQDRVYFARRAAEEERLAEAATDRDAAAVHRGGDHRLVSLPIELLTRLLDRQ